jgi:hypothetical protein
MIEVRVRSPHTYVSPRQRELTDDEIHVRKVAYGLKNGEPEAIQLAAVDMAPAVRGLQHLILAPVPSATTGSDRNNLDLCLAIRRLLPEEQDVMVIRMVDPTKVLDSQCLRHKRGESPRAERDFEFVAMPESIAVSEHYPNHHLMFVDNVVTSGNTLRACAFVFAHQAVMGLVWADARGTIQ